MRAIEEDDPNLKGVKAGQSAAVFIKSIIPERMKIKLVLIDAYRTPKELPPVRYYIDTAKVSRIDYWKYSPDECPRIIETIF